MMRTHSKKKNPLDEKGASIIAERKREKKKWRKHFLKRLVSEHEKLRWVRTWGGERLELIDKISNSVVGGIKKFDFQWIGGCLYRCEGSKMEFISEAKKIPKFGKEAEGLSALLPPRMKAFFSRHSTPNRSLGKTRIIYDDLPVAGPSTRCMICLSVYTETITMSTDQGRKDLVHCLKCGEYMKPCSRPSIHYYNLKKAANVFGGCPGCKTFSSTFVKIDTIDKGEATAARCDYCDELLALPN
jgi:hypothetical protein